MIRSSRRLFSASLATTRYSSSSSCARNDLSEYRLNILNKTIENVPVFGWSRFAVEAACKQLAYPQSMHGLVGNVPMDIILFYQDWLTVQVRQEQTRHDTVSNDDFHSRLFEVLSTRLRFMQPFIHTWPQAINEILFNPLNASVSFDMVNDISHDMCVLAGDDSYNMKWYSRRLMVASVYGAAELFMISDKSHDHQDSLDFLKHRLNDARDVEKKSHHAEEMLRMVGRSLLNVFPQLK